MKRSFVSLLVLVLMCAVSCNDAVRRSAVRLQEGCYEGSAGTVLVFPATQHGRQCVAAIVQTDEVESAICPIEIEDYSDSTGVGYAEVLNERYVLWTNGIDTIEVREEGEQEADTYVLQPAAKNAPKSVAGEWTMSYVIGGYFSIRVLDASVDRDLRCTVAFNKPDSATMAFLAEMALDASDIPDDYQPDLSGIDWSRIIGAFPDTMEGEVWYSPVAGRGVFTSDVAAFVGMPFTAVSASTLEMTFGDALLKLERKK